MISIIGGVIYVLMGLKPIECVTVNLEPHIQAISSILSGYAFTVAGFMATISTFLFALGDKPYFKLYKRRGNFKDLMLLHGFAILILAMVFVLSIFLLAYPELLRVTFALTSMSLLLLLLITIISYRLAHRAND